MNMREGMRTPWGKAQGVTVPPYEEFKEEPCDIRRCKGCSYCSDAYGVDAIKDANAEAGRDPYDDEGWADAERNGWFRGPTY